jgi:uncharacterized membrane protein YfhO
MTAAVVEVDKNDPLYQCLSNNKFLASSNAVNIAGYVGKMPALHTNALHTKDKVVLYRPNTNTVVVTTKSLYPGLLVLADTFYPGWHACIDGKITTIQKANYLFRGIFIPAGQHTITFKYLPESFLIGVVLALVAAIFSLIWLTYSNPKIRT